VFAIGISVNLARGRTPDCHCFGQLHSAPAGWKTLARNRVLAVVAGFVLWEGYEGGAGRSALAWLGAPRRRNLWTSSAGFSCLRS
jgi:hypothetical protein